jgi:hypothetical protein
MMLCSSFSYSNTRGVTAVPEATTGSPMLFRSKRRAASSTCDSLERGSKLKASHNLDTDFIKGNEQHILLHFLVQQVSEKLHLLGFTSSKFEGSMLKFANFLVKSQQSVVSLDFKQDKFSRA